MGYNNTMSIEKAYNNWASLYDTNQNKTRDLDQKITKEVLSKYSFQSVVELGCGTGKNTRWLLEQSEQIIGLDFSQEMLNKAKAKIVSDKVSFLKTDLNKDWNLASNYADLITSSLTLEHIADLDAIFTKVYNVLKKDGLFFISELHPFKQYVGSKAKFENDIGLTELETYTHHISDYIKAAEKNQLGLVEVNEWFDEEGSQSIPRLISFVFRK